MENIAHKPNSVCAKIFNANSTDRTVLQYADPKTSIEHFFVPDNGMPCSLSMIFTDKSGKSITVSINNNEVSFR